MDFKTLLNKPVKRSKFFLIAGAGFITAYNLKSIVQSMFMKKVNKSNSKPIKVKINPLAVCRKKTGGHDV